MHGAADGAAGPLFIFPLPLSCLFEAANFFSRIPPATPYRAKSLSTTYNMDEDDEELAVLPLEYSSGDEDDSDDDSPSTTTTTSPLASQSAEAPPPPESPPAGPPVSVCRDASDLSYDRRA